MFFGFFGGFPKDSAAPDLCLIPERLMQGAVPVKVDSLVSTDCSIHFISVDEAITVSFEPNDRTTKIITAVRPAFIYLTPNLPARPGFGVEKVKVAKINDQEYSCFFDRGKGWEAWKPNVRIL